LPAETKAVLIFLGDQPQIPVSVAKLVIEKWKEFQNGIIIPTFNGKRGHPVLIETRFMPDIEKLDPAKGLKQLMADFNDEILEVECQFSHILRDIDTPDDYENEINIKLNR
jgi:molybdenum cofactor cytidylyltransferase